MNQNNETVVFYPSGHKYVHTGTGQQHTSVTTLIDKYKEPYDTEMWIRYVAVKELFGAGTAYKVRFNYPFGDTEAERFKIWISHELSTEQAKKINKMAKANKEKWKRKSAKALKAGSKIHDKYERTIRGANVILKNNIPYRPMDVFYCDRADFTSRGVAAETTVFNVEYLLAGRVDRVDKDGIDIELTDYKTSEYIKYENKHEKLKYPLDHLDACNGNLYDLQLNTYGWMFSQFGFNVKKLTLVHIRTGKSIPVEINFKNVELMLKHWKENESTTKTKDRESTKINY